MTETHDIPSSSGAVQGTPSSNVTRGNGCVTQDATGAAHDNTHATQGGAGAAATQGSTSDMHSASTQGNGNSVQSNTHATHAFTARKYHSLIGWIIFVTVVLLLEISLFNLPHWQTANLTPQSIASQETISQDESRSFTFDTPQSVQTLRISANRSSEFTVSFLDQGATRIATQFDHSIYIDAPSSQYIRLHPYGDVSAISVTFNKLLDPKQALAIAEDSTAEITFSITANAPIPLNISPLRVLLIIGIAALIWAFLPARRIYRLGAFQLSQDGEDAAVGVVSGADDTPSAYDTVAGAMSGVGAVPSAGAASPSAYDTVADTSRALKLTPFAKKILAAVTAIMCAFSLSQLAILPDTLGEFGKGYSTVSLHNYSNQLRAEYYGYAADGESNEGNEGSEVSQEDEAGKGEEDQNKGSEAGESAATSTPNDATTDTSTSTTSKSSQVSTFPYVDNSPLAYLYPATYESELGKLARAFAAGQLHLLDEPLPEFQEVENPYDPGQREKVLADEASSYWDTAYYDGKFYVYFGVLPVIVFYLPYFLLTGQDLPNYIPVAICIVALLVGLTMLLTQIARRWFPRTSVGVLLLSLLLVMLGAQLSWLTLLPSIYQVPVAMALALLVWAAVCFTSLNRHPRLVIPGALLVALIFACRPQIGLFGLLMVPFGIQALMKKNGVKARTLYLMSALVPIVVVFALIGAYNAARFGNPLDFGAAYNLTTNDMRYRPASLDMALMSIFSYIFQLPNLQPQLPFFDTVLSMNTVEARATLQEMWNYAGNIVVEAPIGGLLWLSPLVWFVLAFFTREGTSAGVAGVTGNTSASVCEHASEHASTGAIGTSEHASNNDIRRLRTSGSGVHHLAPWRGFVLLTALLTVVVVVIDGEGAGILPRYALDFALPLLVLGAAGLMRLETRNDASHATCAAATTASNTTAPEVIPDTAIPAALSATIPDVAYASAASQPVTSGTSQSWATPAATAAPHRPRSNWFIIVGIVMLLIGLVVAASIAFHPNVIRISWCYDMAQLLVNINHMLF